MAPSTDPVPLPHPPSADQLRRRSRELQRRVRDGDAQAHDLITRLVPGTKTGPDFPLHLAQLAVARGHGFASWPRLTQYVELVAGLTHRPVPDPDETADPVEQFVGSAVLRYDGNDSGARPVRAAQMLDAHPDLPTRSLAAAVVAADHGAVERFLTADPEAARRPIGPLDWEPLLYLCYGRLDRPAADVITTAGLLLRSGADPNAGFLWNGLVPPFTALTGILGNGEQGPQALPPHPHELLLARLLLEAGADPNDGQAVYNRMFAADDSHLELLLAYGFGAGDGGPWRRRMPEVLPTPNELAAQQLGWAAAHGMDHRVRLLAPLVDLAAPIRTPWTPAMAATELAMITGHPQTARLLTELGAPAPADPAAALIQALLTGDRPTVDTLSAADPQLLEQVRRQRPSLMLRAAVAEHLAGAKLLVDKGFDVNAMGRSDLPIEQPWHTALHYAASIGNLELIRTLLELGADPDIPDAHYRTTPAVWAEHFGHDAAAQLLRAR